MCGIAGFVSQKLDASSLKRMSDCIIHRGPDADGFFYQNGVGLCHRRLSIIDLSDTGNQPMYSADHAWVIVFNGEIYNYQEIREELINAGCVFKSHSDTEVILNAFQRFGVKAVDRFIGMFAFAIYHQPSATLYIFRDRVGVKPLYYYTEGDEFWFASELKVLARISPHKKVNESAVADYFRLGYIRYPHTIYQNFYKLPPGHYATIKAGKLDVQPYWDVREGHKNAVPSSEGEALERLEELMRSSFNYRMVADVPVGVFLSGGIDSSSLTALLSQSHDNLKTFSIGFDEERYNEAPYAREIANYLGTNHHEKILTAADAEKVLDKYFDIYDEPFADSSGIPVFLISQFAREQGCKVVLSADGGDELFGGYDRYRSVPHLYKKVKRASLFQTVLSPALEIANGLPLQKWNVEHRSAKLNTLLSSANWGFSSFYAAYLSILSDQGLKKLTGIATVPEKRLNAPSSEEEMMLWDFLYYLPEDLLTKVDRASMVTSIEAREPFLDHRLIEFVFSLPLSWRMQPGNSKYLLKKILFKHIPGSYFNRRKMGFSIPLFKWFSERLDKEFKVLFTNEVLGEIPVLNTSAVISEYKKYTYFKSLGKEYNMLLLWHLYVFIKWWQRWMSK